MTHQRNDQPDPVAAIVASGREITAADVELVWGDFIDARSSWQETSARAQALVETVNVPNHVANGALVDLIHLWMPDADRDVQSHRARRARWRAMVEEYDADPLE